MVVPIDENDDDGDDENADDEHNNKDQAAKHRSRSSLHNRLSVWRG